MHAMSRQPKLVSDQKKGKVLHASGEAVTNVPVGATILNPCNNVITANINEMLPGYDDEIAAEFDEIMIGNDAITPGPTP